MTLAAPPPFEKSTAFSRWVTKLWTSVTAAVLRAGDTMTGNLTVPKLFLSSKVIAPTADSTTAIQVMKANGTTAVITIDTTNGYIGIGPSGVGATPIRLFSLQATANGSLCIEAISESLGYSQLQRRARGTPSAKTAITANAALGGLAGDGFDGTAGGGDAGYASSPPARFQMLTEETFTSTARGAYFRFVTTQTATLTAVTALEVHWNRVESFVPVVFPAYTVAGLPAAPLANMRAIVTDLAVAPAFLAAIGAGGGAVRCPVFYNAIAGAWIAG